MHFVYPNGKHLRGQVVKEISVDWKSSNGDYHLVVQQCDVDGGLKPYDVRFGYYRRNPGKKRWKWGSQTTFQADKKTVEKVIRKAIKAGLISL
jgi:hypothetical protein